MQKSLNFLKYQLFLIYVDYVNYTTGSPGQYSIFQSRWRMIVNKETDHQEMADNPEAHIMDNENGLPRIDRARSRYPFCVVWTPIPLLT